jgi:predicted SAM-dependent methyltransferase
MDLYRINLGCGATPTPGWLNFDNSWSVRIGCHPRLVRTLGSLGLIPGESMRFAMLAASHGIRWADAVNRIPLNDSAARAVYSSHMLEHLAPEEARCFLREVRRVLVPGGIVRLAVPDIARLAHTYLRDGDADVFVASTFLATEKPRTLGERLRAVVVGPRHHQWMYDGKSLEKLLREGGFSKVCQVPSGTTGIPNPGALDLFEREDESVYVEGVAPDRQ